jgi:hypothetical protein
MKYIKKLNIDFDNWVDIPMNINEQQIKKLHPIFYQFLIEKNLMNIYLEMFDKCHWKDKGNTFEEIFNYFHNYYHNYYDFYEFFYNSIYFTLNYKCIKTNKLFNNISSLNDEFQLYYIENKK